MREIKNLLAGVVTIVVTMTSSIVRADNTLDIKDLTVGQGEKAVLEIEMNNTDNVTAFSFDLYLPDGINVLTKSDGTLSATLERAASDHTVSGNYKDGYYSFSSLSLSSQAFSGNSGTICKLELYVDKEVELGSYDVVMNNIEMTNPDNTIYRPDEVQCKLTVVNPADLYDEGFSVQILPFEFNEDVSDIPFNVVSTIALTNIEFDVELPSCIGQNELYDLTKSLGTTTANTDITGEYGSLHVSIARKNTKTIPSGSDVAKLELGFDGDLVPTGIYNIEIKNIVLTGNDGGVYHAAPTTSYIKVGNPSNASLVLKGHVSEEMNAALAEDESIGMLDLSDVVSMDGTLTLVDKRGLVTPRHGLTVETVSYTRESGNKWGTVCVPFELASDEKIQYFTLDASGVDLANGTLTFTEASSVSAGTPAVFYRADGGSMSMSATNASIAAGDAGIADGGLVLMGTYVPMTITGDNYFIAQDAFWKAGETAVSVPAFRAYFEGVNAGVNKFSINTGETGVKSVTVEVDKQVIYDLMGCRLKNTEKGVNIVNGRKVLIR